MFKVTTKRMTEEEIDKAIENPEKRGYRLLVKKQQPFHWIAVLVKE